MPSKHPLYTHHKLYYDRIYNVSKNLNTLKFSTTRSQLNVKSFQKQQSPFDGLQSNSSTNNNKSNLVKSLLFTATVRIFI